MSLVARRHSVAASQLFLWHKQYQDGSLTVVAAAEQVVPASELASAMKQIKELQRLLGKKTMENELLKEAVEYGRQAVGTSASLMILKRWPVYMVLSAICPPMVIAGYGHCCANNQKLTTWRKASA